MNTPHCSTNPSQLPPAYQRAKNIQRDLGKAVGLYGLGDRSKIVLRTLALGKVAFDTIGQRVPVPLGIDEELWQRILGALALRFNVHAFPESSTAA